MYFFISGLIVTGLPILGATFVVVNNECFNSFSGEISMTINGGQLPYTIETTGPEIIQLVLLILNY
jgi:hypothetical protein